MSRSWMLLLLLLPLLNSVHQSSSAPTPFRGAMEFSKHVGILEADVQSCSENCSSSQVTDRGCECLNISVSQSNCSSADYFIHGLKSLQSRNFSQESIQPLIQALTRWNGSCLHHRVINKMTYVPFISPKTFCMQLRELAEQINSWNGSKK